MFQEPRKVLETSWNFISLISVIIGILGLISAGNLEDQNLKGFGFGAIWSMFLVIFLTTLGQYVLGGSARGFIGRVTTRHSTPFLTGFWLGTTFMLSIAFFVLGCIYASFGETDIKTLGAFFLMQFFFLSGFSVYALMNRKVVYSSTQESNAPEDSVSDQRGSVVS